MLICFLQFFLIKHSNNFFTFKITNNICAWVCVFNFFNHKNFFRPIQNISFSKIFLYLETLTWSPTLNLESLSLTYLSLTSTGFNIIVLWYVLLYSFTISFNLLMYTLFDIEVIYSGFESSNKSFSKDIFSFIVLWTDFNATIF